MFRIFTYQYLSIPIPVYPDFLCSFSAEHLWHETRQYRRKHSGNVPWLDAPQLYRWLLQAASLCGMGMNSFLVPLGWRFEEHLLERQSLLSRNMYTSLEHTSQPWEKPFVPVGMSKTCWQHDADEDLQWAPHAPCSLLNLLTGWLLRQGCNLNGTLEVLDFLLVVSAVTLALKHSCAPRLCHSAFRANTIAFRLTCTAPKTSRLVIFVIFLSCFAMLEVYPFSGPSILVHLQYFRWTWLCLSSGMEGYGVLWRQHLCLQHWRFEKL